MRIWKLKKGSDQRLRSRHPWVFSNELMDSPRGLTPGELVEVHDYQGHFIARGYGNPHSLIAFRAMTFELKDFEIGSPTYVSSKLYTAWEKRIHLGFQDSFRICFSEADSLPGLILDRYVFEKNGERFQVLSYQLLTYGMNRIFEQATEIYQKLVEGVFSQKLSDIDWEHTILLQRNDVNIRKLEGLEVEEPKVIYNPKDISLTDLTILIPSVMATTLNTTETLKFNVNLIEGQKTGFFLDQTHNIRLLIQSLEGLIRVKQFTKEKPLKIVDLCCYMGQWSAQVAFYLNKKEIPFEVLLVDVSELALEKAKENLKQYTSKVTVMKADVLKDLGPIESNSFDVVISDPPAFVKNKKDMESGLHGYMKLNEQAFRIVKAKGVVASCTCSGVVQVTDFKNSLRKSILRSGKKVQLICEGGLGWDHPSLIQFPEGQYLKMLLHKVD
ncbi:MAG: methyltransferase domain-containing protein [Pseudobdellovibrio sp.]|nr:methyltransferase domain-containing protein [Pseudobdellovibrio sp.]